VTAKDKFVEGSSELHAQRTYVVLMILVISVIQPKEEQIVLEYVNAQVVQVKDRVVEDFSELHVQRIYIVLILLMMIVIH
jgi:hypothetical protein